MRQHLVLLTKFEKSKDFWLIFFLVLLFVLLRTPSLIEPYWYGDEGIYEVIGKAISSNRLLYRDIWDNKPPVLYLYYAIFNGEQFWVRFLSLIFGAGGVIAFYALSLRLLKNRLAVIISTLSFSTLFGLPVLEGNIANAENFMIFPILCSFALIYKSRAYSSYILSGLLVSFAFLTKIVGLFDFLSLLFFIFIFRIHNTESLRTFFENFKYHLNKKTFNKRIQNEASFVIAFITPIIATCLFFLVNGAFADFLSAVFFKNVGYVGWGNFFFFPLGFLGFKILMLLVALFLLLYFRRRFDTAALLIYSWVFLSLFNTFFSQRPYTHYLLVLLPSFCLLLGYAILNFKKVFHFAFLILVLAIVLSYFKIYKKVIPYYSNYFSFVFGEKSFNSYQNFFDSISVRDYRISDFISGNTKKSDYVFLWSDSGQIYYLSDKLPIGRYIVAYHILSDENGLSILQGQIDLYKPVYIIVTKDPGPIYKILQSYTLKYMIDSAFIYERKI